MRIGYVQFEPKLGALAENRKTVRELLLRAPEADLLVLPELASSGYHFATRADAWESSETVDGPFTATLIETARERNCTYVAGLCEREGNHLWNSAVVVGPGGRIGLYRKAHLFLNEKDLFEPGNLGLPVFDLGTYRLGVLICFDWQFPEAWRVLALEGAEIVAHPSNLVIPGRCQRVVPVHALSNRLFVVTANRIGEERGLTFTGRSQINDPRGETLSEAAAEGTVVEVVDIDPNLARDKQVTARNDLLADRRPELYGAITRFGGPFQKSLRG